MTKRTDLTPEEFDELYQENENFDGRRADFCKLRLYQEIKGDLTEFLQHCDDVLKLTEIKPNRYERNALICLDIKAVSTFDRDELAKLTAIMNKADRVIVSGAESAGVRLSFGVENVWVE